MGMLDGLPVIGKRQKKTVSEDDAGAIGAAFKHRFGASVAATTDETIAAVASEERSAAKSQKQRGKGKRAKVRNENFAARVEPNVKRVLTELAKRHGGKTMADGLHIAVALLMESEGIAPSMDAEEEGKQ